MFVVSAANLTFFCSNFLFLLCFFSTLYVFFCKAARFVGVFLIIRYLQLKVEMLIFDLNVLIPVFIVIYFS